MFSGPRRGKRSSEEIRPRAPSVNRDYNGNIWPVSNIKKSVSGRLESSQAVNCVVGKKKILPKNMCSGGRTGMCKSWISNWSWCPPTERDMHTHTHRTPWQFLGTASAQLDINQMKPICDRSTPPQLYSILEQAGSSPRTRTHGRTVTPAEERLMERWRQDGKMLSSPFPRCHTGSYLTLLRVALLSAPCCDPALLIPLLFLTLRLTPPSFLRLSFFLNPRETVLHFCLSVFKLFLSQTPGSPSFFPQHAPQFHPPWLNPALSPRAPFTSDFDRPYFVAGTVKRTLWDWVEVAQTHTHWHLVVTQHSWSWDFHVLQEMSSLDSKWFVLQRIPALNFLEIAVVSHKYLHQRCI